MQNMYIFLNNDNEVKAAFFKLYYKPLDSKMILNNMQTCLK